MTIRRENETIWLEGECAVEEAEVLMHELQAGARLIDWSGCAHLHTACLQVIMAAGVPTRGEPANPLLARWLGEIAGSPGLRAVAAADQSGSETVGRQAGGAAETGCLTEA